MAWLPTWQYEVILGDLFEFYLFIFPTGTAFAQSWDLSSFPAWFLLFRHCPEVTSLPGSRPGPFLCLSIAGIFMTCYSLFLFISLKILRVRFHNSVSFHFILILSSVISLENASKVFFICYKIYLRLIFVWYELRP